MVSLTTPPGLKEGMIKLCSVMGLEKTSLKKERLSWLVKDDRAHQKSGKDCSGERKLGRPCPQFVTAAESSVKQCVMT